jgi:hypothetical protein
MANGSWTMADGASSHTPSPLAINHEPSAINSNGDGASPSLRDLRNGDPQFPFSERGPRPGGVARLTEADDASEAAVAALDEMEARFPPRSAGGFLAGDQHRVPFADDPHGSGIDAGQIDGDFEGVVGLVYVQRRRTLSRGGLGPERAAELSKDLPRLGGKISDFQGEPGVMPAWTHEQWSHDFSI